MKKWMSDGLKGYIAGFITTLIVNQGIDIYTILIPFIAGFIPAIFIGKNFKSVYAPYFGGVLSPIIFVYLKLGLRFYSHNFYR